MTKPYKETTPKEALFWTIGVYAMLFLLGYILKTYFPL